MKLQMGVRELPDFVSDLRDLRAAQLSLAESLYDNSDYKGAQEVLHQVIASAKAARDIPSETETGVSPLVRVHVKTFYAANREETSNRSEDNLRMMRSAIAEVRKERLPAGEVATAQGALAVSPEERGRLDEAGTLYRELLQSYSSELYTACDEADLHKKPGVIQNLHTD